MLHHATAAVACIDIGSKPCCLSAYGEHPGSTYQDTYANRFSLKSSTWYLPQILNYDVQAVPCLVLLEPKGRHSQAADAAIKSPSI